MAAPRYPKASRPRLGPARSRPAPSWPHGPRPQPIALPGLSQAPPLFCRQTQRPELPGPESPISGAVPSALLLADSRGLRFPVTAPRGRAVGTRALAPPLPRGRHPGNRAATQAPPPAIPGGVGGAS